MCSHRAGRQREFAKEEQEKFEKAAADAAASQALGVTQPPAAVQLDGWGDSASASATSAQAQGNEHTHKRQQHPRVREQVAKRGRNRGPSSRPTSATSMVKPEGADTATPHTAGASTAAAQGVEAGAFSTAPSAPALPQTQAATAKASAASDAALKGPDGEAAAQVASSVAQLKLDAPVSLSPVLDPVARHPAAAADGSLPDLRAFQIERPSNAKGTAVTRPRSATVPSDPFSASPSTDLANGMPALPADLAFDSVLEKPSLGSTSSQGPNINFGRMQVPQPNQAMDRLHPGAFPAALFPISSQGSSRSGAMWQPPPPPKQAPNPQPNLAAAVESFYAARAVGSGGSFGNTGSTAFSGGPSSNPPANPPLSLPQFGSFGAGTFGTGLQFGQLGGAFGQSPFIPTGKQPDWSTGPIPGNTNPPSQPAAAFNGRGSDPLTPPGLGRYNARSQHGMPNGTAPGSGLRQGGLPSAPPAGSNIQPSTPAAFAAPFDAAAGLPDDVFDEPKQVLLSLWHSCKSHQVCLTPPTALRVAIVHSLVFIIRSLGLASGVKMLL